MKKVKLITVAVFLYSMFFMFTNYTHAATDIDLCILPETGFSRLNILMFALVVLNLLVYRVFTDKINENK